MAIPAHTHDFVIPTASAAEVLARSSDSLAVTPSAMPAIIGQAASTASLRAYLDALVYVADRDALRALDTSLDKLAFLQEAGRQGVFYFDSSDLSTEVTADSSEYDYVAPTSDATGASGAWKSERITSFIPAGASSSTTIKAMAAETLRGVYNLKQSNTRLIRTGLDEAAAGVSRCPILWIGDSTMAGQAAGTGTGGLVACQQKSIPNFVASILSGKAFNPNLDTFIRGPDKDMDSRITFGSGWGVAGNYYQNTTTTTELEFAPAGECDRVVIRYVRSSGNATFNVKIDGSTVETVNAAGALSVQTKTYSPTLGTHTIEIARTGTGTLAAILTVEAYNSAVPDTPFWNLGKPGAEASYFSNEVYSYSVLNMIKVLQPKLAFIKLGVNNSALNSMASYKADMEAIIAAVQITGDVILVGTPPNNYEGTAGNNDLLLQYERELMVEQDVPYVDLNEIQESWAVVTSLGLNADQVHRLAQGYMSEARVIASLPIW